MSSLFEANQATVKILDAGAGIGNLLASCVVELCSRERHPERIEVTAYEVEERFIPYLQKTMKACQAICQDCGIFFQGTIRQADFIHDAVTRLTDDLFGQDPELFSLAILNPPYKKISSSSETRAQLNSINLETSNLYSAFVGLAAQLLEKDGELVAITPRSFCNGPYFRNFRKLLLELMQIRRLHIFESRDRAFQVDDVLQENIILHASKDNKVNRGVLISCSDHPNPNDAVKHVGYEQVIYPGDRDFFIHIPSEEISGRISQQMAQMPATLQDLGLTVSTGRVVDFRARDFLREHPAKDTSPLIYPLHFSQGYVEWPNYSGKKPNALIMAQETESLFVPSGYYVLAKRFSAKEEPRRVVAAIHDPNRILAEKIGFENHLNYFHAQGQGLEPALAKGLALYLNSSLVDQYFRQFNGHTQVNATDLRKIRYPSKQALIRLGAYMNGTLPAQDAVDIAIEREIFAHDRQTAHSQDDQKAH